MRYRSALTGLFNVFLLNMIVSIGGAFAVLLPLHPTRVRFPNRDSGVFLYLGWRILNGELPYRDVWDHKPPVIFYLDALGLKLGGGQWVGVWWLEVVWLTATLAILYWTLQRLTLSLKGTIWGIALFATTLVCTIHGGNLPPEYALLFQVMGLALLVDRDLNSRHNLRNLFLLGLLGGTTFLTKPTLISLWLGVGVYLTWQRARKRCWRCWLREMAALGVGVTLPVVGIAGYFMWKEAFHDFWEAAFYYNFAYIKMVGGGLERGEALAFGVMLLSCGGLLPMAAIGSLRSYRETHTPQERVQRSLRRVIFVALFFETILIGLSGRRYTHYYISSLPLLTVLVSIGATHDTKILGKIRFSLNRPLFVVLFIAWMGIPWMLRSSGVVPTGYATQERLVTMAYLRDKLRDGPPEETVLFWGAEAGANFLLRRRSPTRFVYLYPLYTPGFAQERILLDFLDSLLKDPPRYVVDTSNPLTPWVAFPFSTPIVEERVRQYLSHLHLVAQLGEWKIYEWR